MSVTSTWPASWPAWRFLGRLIAFRLRLWGPNALFILLVAVLETVPGLLARSFFDWLASAARPLEPFWWLLALLALSAVGRVAFLVGCQLTNAPFMYTSAALLQHNLLRRLLQLPAAAALPHSSGEALSRFRDDVEETSIFLIPFNDLVAFSCFALVGLVVMFSINPIITLGVFLPLVGLSAVLHAARTRIEAYRRAVRAATADVTSYLADVFAAVQTIQVAGAEEGIIGHFGALNQARLRTAIRDRLLDQVLQSIARNTANFGIGGILLLVSQAVQAGSFGVGDFALFVFYLGWVGELTAIFGLVVAKYRQVGVSFERMVELLQGSPPPALVQHRPVFVSVAARPAVPAPRLEVLEVSDLSYVYPSSGRGIHGLSLRLEHGRCLVITGRIGSGKTTALRALLGLLPRQSGQLRWNGELVEDPASVLVPPYCAYTPQVPHLFTDSLSNNLLLGRSPAEARMDLEWALATAQLEADLATLGDGLDSQVGPRGVALSGGQLQRAAAARMLVQRPALLVLDDLSSLDGPTEEALWAALRADPETTILAASHRQAALRRADCILVLRDGVVLDAGGLDELLARCEEMRRLWTAG